MIEQSKNRIKAIQNLEIAKAIPRKVIFLPRGVTGDFISEKKQGYNNRNPKPKGINHQDVLEMLKTHNQSEVARHFRITSQAVSYIKKKFDNG